MKMRSGSCMLIIMILSSVLLVVITSNWLDVMYVHNLAIMRGIVYQRKALLEGLLYYGVASAEHLHANNTVDSDMTKELQLDQWPSKECNKIFGKYSGNISIKCVDNCYHIHAQLHQNNTCSQQGSCMVRFDNESSSCMAIEEWNV